MFGCISTFNASITPAAVDHLFAIQQGKGNPLQKSLVALVIVVIVLFLVTLLFAMYLFISAQLRSSPGSPLEQAVSDEDTDKVRTLLSAGANVNITTAKSYQILPDGNITLAIPIGGSSSPNAGMSLLSLAAMQGNKEILRLLLEKGADPNSKDQYGQTPLIVAAWQGDGDCVKLLLSKHADVNARDQSGKTALLWAETEKHPSATEILKKAGAGK